MRSYEGLTWAQIMGNTHRNHTVDVADMVKQAQDRLVEIQMDDYDELWRFRFTGEQRVWGIKEGTVFRVLWWDPEHRVCPSRKKHT